MAHKLRRPIIRRNKKRSPRRTAKLTGRDILFINEYLLDFNGTRAAIAAKFPGASAAQAASRLLKTVKVRQELARRQKIIDKKYEVVKEHVIRELALLAFSNMKDYAIFGPSGVKLIDSETLSRDQMAAVAEVGESTSESGGSIRFKLHDKRGSLQDLGKHLGLFPTKIDFDEDKVFAIRIDDLTPAEREGLKESRAKGKT